MSGAHEVLRPSPERGNAGPGPTPERGAPRVHGASTRCPFCHEDVAVADAGWVACARCLARHHAACQREADACASCGHEGFLLRAETVLPHDAPRCVLALAITCAAALGFHQGLFAPWVDPDPSAWFVAVVLAALVAFVVGRLTRRAYAGSLAAWALVLAGAAAIDDWTLGVDGRGVAVLDLLLCGGIGSLAGCAGARERLFRVDTPGLPRGASVKDAPGK